MCVYCFGNFWNESAGITQTNPFTLIGGACRNTGCSTLSSVPTKFGHYPPCIPSLKSNSTICSFIRILTMNWSTISAIGTTHDLAKTYGQLRIYTEKDIESNNSWLYLALEKKNLKGLLDDYLWTVETKVPVRELEEIYSVVLAINDKERLKYRFVKGQLNNRSILMRKISAFSIRVVGHMGKN